MPQDVSFGIQWCSMFHNSTTIAKDGKYSCFVDSDLSVGPDVPVVPGAIIYTAMPTHFVLLQSSPPIPPLR